MLRDQRAANDARVAEEQKEALQAKAEGENCRLWAEENTRLQQVLGSITAAGYNLYGFLDKLLNTRDRATSSQVSQMLIAKGSDLLESMRQCQPKVVQAWAIKTTGEMLACKSSRLAEHLRPQQNRGISNLLKEFSLIRIMSDAEEIAPTLCELLRAVGMPETVPSAQ